MIRLKRLKNSPWRRPEIGAILSVRVVFTLLLTATLFSPFSWFGNGALAGQPFQRIEIPSSPNPVGSGARALGMGGAFIAIADDATAASWNPGGLTQLETPEVSIVGDHFLRAEDNTFGTNPEASGDQSVSETRLNYLSATYPFTVFDRNMVVSMNYQNLYDFTREWRFPLSRSSETLSENQHIDYQQDGTLSAYGLAYAIQLTHELSFGFTLNLWENGIYKNEWVQKVQTSGSGSFHGKPFASGSNSSDEYSFSGFNANFGILWNVTSRLTLGAVYKTPFTADIKRNFSFISYLDFLDTPYIDSKVNTPYREKGNLNMPMAYGVGVAYRFSDQFTMAADIYRTEWGDYVYEDSKGNKTCPINGLPESKSDVDATHQVRIGGEYLFIRENCVIPLRGGIFYDPSPAQGSPDAYFGVSVGSGIAYGQFVFDLAYQFRFGNNVGASILQDFYFSQDVREHTVYASMIVHF